MAKQTANQLFDKIRARLEATIRELPRKVGNEIVNYSLEAFEKQAWDDVPWKPREKNKDAGRALLIGKGRGVLKRSIRVVRTTYNSVTVGTDIPYAPVHNFGLEVTKPARQDKFERPRYLRGKKSTYFGGMGAFRKMTFKEKNTPSANGLKFKAYNFKMPKRQFLGFTPTLQGRIRKLIIDEINSAIVK